MGHSLESDHYTNNPIQEVPLQHLRGETRRLLRRKLKLSLAAFFLIALSGTLANSQITSSPAGPTLYQTNQGYEMPDCTNPGPNACFFMARSWGVDP